MRLKLERQLRLREDEIAMVKALQFSDQDWERIALDWQAWWAGELDRPLVMIESPPRRRA